MTEVVESCPFCAYAAGRFVPKLIAYQDENGLVLPSRAQKPNNRGHCLVTPRVHVPTLHELPDELAGPLLRAVSLAARAVKRAYSADGVSIRQNNEAASGQDVVHLHFHVIPRFADDDFDTARYERITEQTRIEQATALRSAWGA